MQQKTKDRIWNEVVTQLNSGHPHGPSYKLKFAHSTREVTIEIFNGQRWTMPPKVVAQLTGEAKALIDTEREKADEATRKWCEEHRKEREALDARLDEDGFALLAGEETEIVTSGTLRHCRDNLYRVMQYPRCPYAGKGCWLITDSHGNEVQSGEFDKDMVL